MENKSSIWVENVSFLIPSEERDKLEKLLGEHQIELIFIERAARAG